MTSSPTEQSESVNVKETSVVTTIENKNEVVILVDDEPRQDSEDDPDERPFLFEDRGKSEVRPIFKLQFHDKGKQKTPATGHLSKKVKDIRPPPKNVEDVEDAEGLDRELDESAVKAMAKKIRKGKKASNK